MHLIQLLSLVAVNIVDDSAETKKTLPPAYPDPQAPITRRGILPSFCNPGLTVEIRDKDLVRPQFGIKKIVLQPNEQLILICFVAWTMPTGN